MMIELSVDEAIELRGILETIMAEAEGMPQVGGNEATIIDQAGAGLEILDRELSRDGVVLIEKAKDRPQDVCENDTMAG